MNSTNEAILKSEKVKKACEIGNVLQITQLASISSTEQMIEEIKNMESDENRPCKRKRVVLTLEDKMNVIKERDKGNSYETIAKRFNIGSTTVKDIIKRRDKIIKAIASDRETGLRRKVVCTGRKPEVEERLYNYLVEKTDQGEGVSNKDIIKLAAKFSKEIYNEDWTPSAGWVGKFKNRFGIDTKYILIDHVSDESENELIYDECQVVSPTNEEETSTQEPIISEDLNEHKNVASVSVLNACDIVLDFMQEFNFPLKEIITLRVVKDKISKIPQGQTLYEVHQDCENVKL